LAQVFGEATSFAAPRPVFAQDHFDLSALDRLIVR